MLPERDPFRCRFDALLCLIGPESCQQAEEDEKDTYRKSLRKLLCLWVGDSTNLPGSRHDPPSQHLPME